MRRLPIFFVIDVSESMIGEPISEVGTGMRTMIQLLRQDPYALETTYISIIIFAGRAKTLVPLTDVVSFYPPQLPIGGGTSLGAGIQHLMSELETKLVKNDGVTKGDWKPIIFLFTDGSPTDNPDITLREWETKYRNRVNLVAISVGNNTDLQLLRRLTDNVLLFNDTKPEAYKEFFKWISASIATQSQKIEMSNKDDFQLEKLNETIAYKFDFEKTTTSRIDENYVVLNARCQQNSLPYLIKFRRNQSLDEWAEFISEGFSSYRSGKYTLNGAFPIPSPEDYQELTVEAVSQHTVNAEDLEGNPSCPCCGNPFGFGTCGCGGILCIRGPGENFCPHCKQTVTFHFTDESFDVKRGLG
jgi:uncharacterized protein YegL